jgi:hypothetical protein
MKALPLSEHCITQFIYPILFTRHFVRVSKAFFSALFICLFLGCSTSRRSPKQDPTPIQGHPAIYSIGESPILTFEKGKRLIIPISGSDLFQGQSAWSVKLEGVVPAIRNEDYELNTFYENPQDNSVGLGNATLVLKETYTTKAEDGDTLTVKIDIVRAADEQLIWILQQLADVERAVTNTLSKTVVSDFNIGHLEVKATTQSITQSIPDTLSDKATLLSAVNSLTENPVNSQLLVAQESVKLHALQRAIRQLRRTMNDQVIPKTRFPVLASGTRTFQLYTASTYREKFLRKRLSLNEIKAFPLPDAQAIELFGKVVQEQFYIVALSVQNTSDQDRVINTGLINAYGRAIVYPAKTDDDRRAFTIPVQIPPQSLQQEYNIVSGPKWARPREWVFRSLEFGGSLATAIATGFQGTPDLIRALGVYSGVGVPAFGKLWPDQVPNYLANIVNFGMPELIKISQNGSMGFKLLFFSKDDLHSMISDPSMFAENSYLADALGAEHLKKPRTYVVFLSFDTMEVPFESSAESPTGFTVTVPPSSIVRPIGESASFTVEAVSKGTMLFQWHHGALDLQNGPDIAGANTKTLTLHRLKSGQGGNYSVTVTDSSGAKSTTTAVLGLVPPSLQVRVDEVSNPIAVGTAITLKGIVSGGTPNDLQWFRDGAALVNAAGSITGADTADLTISRVTLADTGMYTLRARDAVNSTVISPPIRVQVSQ